MKLFRPLYSSSLNQSISCLVKIYIRFKNVTYKCPRLCFWTFCHIESPCYNCQLLLHQHQGGRSPLSQDFLTVFNRRNNAVCFYSPLLSHSECVVIIKGQCSSISMASAVPVYLELSNNGQTLTLKSIIFRPVHDIWHSLKLCKRTVPSSLTLGLQ